MRKALQPHPDTPCDAVTSIDVELARPGPAELHLVYLLGGAMGDVRLPPPTSLQRGDRLWEHTCLELFILPGSGEAYHEFNFAPSLEWASYRLSGYRRGMQPSLELPQPRLETSEVAGCYRMEVSLDVAPLADLMRAQPWRVGMSAIIEERSGRKSYWALAHPQGEPDFHHKDCFALELPAAKRP